MNNKSDSLKAFQQDHRIPIKSTWRDAIGKRLTDRTITKYIKMGKYGVEVKLRFFPPKEKKQPRVKAAVVKKPKRVLEEFL